MEIGEGRNALLCITSKIDCCKNTKVPSTREWYFPNGTSVKIEGRRLSFYRDRDPSIVRLNRRNNAASPTGIFKCAIPSSTQLNRITTSTIHIGIYDIGQGKLVFLCSHDICISEFLSTGIPKISSFMFSRSSTSLNCTSHGGPVTTVTWKMNNQKLIIDGNDYQQTQVIVDSMNAVYINTLYSNDTSNLVGVFTCTVENARGSDSMTITTNGKLLKSSIISLTHFIYIVKIGVVIDNAENYTVGSDANITCHSDTDTERIEWLTHERVIIDFESNETQLDLLFMPVNDSVHGQVYICRVIRNHSDMPERNFTMNVKGK